MSIDIADTLLLIVTGFAVVLGALALLWLISAAIGRLFAGGTSAAAAPPPATAPSPPTADVTAPHLAAIAATVAAVTDGRGRVVSVRAPAHLATAWASEGRADQLASHRLRWNWEAAATRRSDRPPTAMSSAATASDHKGNP